MEILFEVSSAKFRERFDVNSYIAQHNIINIFMYLIYAQYYFPYTPDEHILLYIKQRCVIIDTYTYDQNGR